MNNPANDAASPAVRARLADLRWGFIGAGRVAHTLAMAMAAAVPRKADQRLRLNLQVYSRSPTSAQALARGVEGAHVASNAQALVDTCDVVFITVNDDAIAEVCRRLRWRPGVSAVHCSGATPLSALAHAQSQGCAIGGLHPLHTFGDPHVALRGLAGAAVAIEAQEPLRKLLWDLAQAWGCQPFELPSEARALYHASAHYAGAFIVALMREATQLWARFGVTEDQALQALLPLLRGTVASMQASGLPQGMAGVVARGDIGTLAQHLQALSAQAPQQEELYRRLSALNIPLAMEKGSINESTAQQLHQLLYPSPESS